jgi:hypothetical protein
LRRAIAYAAGNVALVDPVIAVPIAAASGGVSRSSASRHNTQSLVACAYGEIFLRTESRPFTDEHSRAAAAGNFYGMISAAGIDDDDLACERHRRKATGELRGCVASDHTKA